MSGRVKVVNPWWKGSPWIKRKIAVHYVSEGRSVWLGADQQYLRIVESHPKNVVAAAKAGARQAEYVPPPDGDSHSISRSWRKITHKLRLFGVNPPADNSGRRPRHGGGLAAVDHTVLHFEPPPQKRDHLLTSPSTDTICESYINYKGIVGRRVLPKPRYVSKSTIGRYTAMSHEPPGEEPLADARSGFPLRLTEAG